MIIAQCRLAKDRKAGTHEPIVCAYVPEAVTDRSV